MALSISRNPYTGLPDIVGTAGGGGGGGHKVAIAAGTQTATHGTVVFSNSNGVTFGMSNSSVITASVAGGGGGGNTGSISAGTTRGTLGEMVFSNSNGLSFGIDGQTLTGSYSVPSTAGLISAINVSAGTTSNNASAVVFSNSNGISFGLNGSTITGSHNALTSQSNQAFSASGGSSAFQTLSFNNANGATFSNAGGAVQLSYTVPSTAGLLSAVNFSAGTTSNNSASIQFANSNGVSFGLNAGTITATVATNYLTSQSNQAFSASGGSSTFQTINFVNGNGATFTNNAGSVGLSYTVPTVPAQTNQTIGAYAVSNTTGAASSTTIDARSLSFQGAGVASVGMTNGSVVISVPSGGGAGDGGNVLAAGTQTANTTGTVLFQNSNGVTFGMSNNSVITASVAAGGGGGVTHSFYDPAQNYNRLAAQLGQGSMVFAPCKFQNVSFDRIVTPVLVSNATNSTGTITASYSFGLYTKNASTLSLVQSTSGSLSVSFSGSVSTTHYTGVRNVSFGWSSSVSEGLYYMGYWSRTTTGGANGTISNMVQSNIGSNYSGMINASSNSSQQFYPGQGVYSATFSTAMPSSVALTHIQGTAITVGLRPPIWYLTNGSY
jgi:hypothetical protein